MNAGTRQIKAVLQLFEDRGLPAPASTAWNGERVVLTGVTDASALEVRRTCPQFVVWQLPLNTVSFELRTDNRSCKACGYDRFDVIEVLTWNNVELRPELDSPRHRVMVAECRCCGKERL